MGLNKLNLGLTDRDMDAVFRVADIDGSGHIAMNEFVNVFRNDSFERPEFFWDQTRPRGLLERQDRIIAMKEHSRAKVHVKYDTDQLIGILKHRVDTNSGTKEVFNALDGNRSGRVASNEIVDALREMQVYISDQEAQDVVAKINSTINDPSRTSMTYAAFTRAFNRGFDVKEVGLLEVGVLEGGAKRMQPEIKTQLDGYGADDAGTGYGLKAGGPQSARWVKVWRDHRAAVATSPSPRRQKAAQVEAAQVAARSGQIDEQDSLQRWEAMRTAPDKRVIYLTAERFLSTFVRAVMDKQTAAFKEELRAADLLLIDDVHFVGGKQSTQEELFHTLTALMEDGRRVVFSSDRAPAALDEIDARLRSHLQAGLVCGIEPADRTLRLGILEKKLDLLGRQQGLIGASARPEVLQFLADRFTESVRELEGALNTLVARVGEGVSRLTLDEAQAILRPHLRGGEKRITIDDIQKATSEHFGLKQVDLISERRNRSIARPRQAAMWLAKQLTTRSLPDIGRRFGGRDHTTVLHAVRRIEALRAEDPQLARDLETLTRKLRG